MSRSYRKNPGSFGNSRYAKKFANRTVRHFKKDLSSGMSYKNLFDSLSIRDHIWIYWPSSKNRKNARSMQSNLRGYLQHDSTTVRRCSVK